MGNHVAGEKPMRVEDPDPDELSTYETGGQHWSERPDAEAKIHYPKKGPASRELMPAMSVPEAFALAVKKRAKKPVLWQEPPAKVQADKATKKVPPPLARPEWRVWTWEKYYGDVRRTAKAMMAVGFAQHDACTIFGFNAPEWHISALGAMVAGGKASGVYPSDTPEQFQYKTHHSRSSVVVVETNEHVQIVQGVVNDLPYLKAVVVWAAPPATTEIKRADGTTVPVFGYEAFLEMGAIKTSEAELDERVKAIKPGHVASLIYTSGTTGQPKAVMITHDSILYESRIVVAEGVSNVARNPDEVERVLSYLPLSHVAGQMVDILCPIAMTAFHPGACEVYFARPYDLKLGSIGERLRDVKPTLFLGVPRVWEKIAEKIKSVGARTKGFKKKIAAWAKAKGLEMAQNQQLGGSGERPSMYGLADKLVLSKVQAALGLDEVKFAFTGAAPISVDTLAYFGSLGIQINEVYGMSECTGATTWSTDGKHSWGSVGFALPGMEVRVFKVAGKTMTECPRTQSLEGPQPEACQGEICCRGRHVMAGYLANPDMGEEHVLDVQKKNAATIDENGWLHTGDMGVKDLNGLIRIVGRYKELIIGAGGENIAPIPIEDEIKKLAEGVISNVMMIGDKRKYNVALITLMVKGATGERPGNNELDGRAAELVPGVATIEDACKSEQFIKFIEEAITDTNGNGQVCPSNAARIAKFTILARPAGGDFSVETEELTSTFKLRRNVVEKMYAAAIEAMYDESLPGKQMFVPFKA